VFEIIFKTKKSKRRSFVHANKPVYSIGAQVSLEYLLLLAAFFAALVLVLPVASSSATQFLESSDVLLAKRIVANINEKVSLLQFLGSGSRFELEYFPAKEVVIYSKGNQIVVSVGNKEFVATTDSQQLLLRESFVRQFKIIILKNEKYVQIIAQSS
jgi:hypothetical protein